MKKAFVKVGNRKIQEQTGVFIVAEAGVNHNGSLSRALEMVDIAAQARADAVKFQTFEAEEVVTKYAKLAEYQKRNLGKPISQLAMIRSLELSEKDFHKIADRCRQKNILFLSTPHGGAKSVDLLESLGVAAYKIGSGDLTNYLLLKRVAKTGKPIILSTGMATLDEIRGALSFLHANGNNQIVVLHTTTNYPCPPDEVNLRAMLTMMHILEEPVGFSDHTNSDLAAIAATVLGMALYECHFTLDKNLPGPDHKASASPEELTHRILAIHTVQILLGSSEKTPTFSETHSMRSLVRKSLVYARNLPKGHALTESDLAAKRPGLGMSPAEFEQVVGTTLTRPVKKDQLVASRDLHRQS